MTNTYNGPAVTVIGAGLAGAEASWQLLRFGIPVNLIDMKPEQFTPAHHQAGFAELVCSNSLRSDRLSNAVGLLKAELRLQGSLIMDAADHCRIPAGGALAVDRDEFSAYITQKLKQHPLLSFTSAQIDAIPAEGIVVIATGPLTQGRLLDHIQNALGAETLHFFDAAAPIISLESIDQSIAFRQSRYDRGSADYLNCPMDQQQYEHFVAALINGELADVKDFDRETVFEGCMPIETMAKRGKDTIRYGPLKPVGLTDPRTGRRPYACVQLRQDDRADSMYNMVGFQTRLRFGQQREIFRLIPGLENAEILRYGVMHRNTFLNSPQTLTATYQARLKPDWFFAGQMTGVEGYVESTASGLLAGINAALRARGLSDPYIPSAATVCGSMAAYISDPAVRHFQPMNANFGLVTAPQLPADLPRKAVKEARQQALIETSLMEIKSLAVSLPPI
ncbi:MAG: methylenetetrahydrofolate--tRNA-(uracil(54)-C(5))-methyltransferase (FADH(2)-oxidizing) TrmFO [Oscillospiraceae bacterium]|nr:methylenetetrahydrofolate--tRNA-(uracil(54)-C(5))-methyltransferase (FADH(2)-oxidizing) TrmFO [Oscillospiraceae bacterium]MDD4367969.1 methylenetetrahydrofolate--tRNA-(uracil(54)-C(5))-methyltransferase (FADH(2)-oxidizing) TrmFO [Oscillospiraceae bacterium]